MQIPKHVDYGVRALVDLAINHKSGLARTSDIAKRQNIPEPYLAQVLHSLQRNGLTEAQRGPLGGHSLKMDPSLITMGMVMRIVIFSSFLYIDIRFFSYTKISVMSFEHIFI